MIYVLAAFGLYLLAKRIAPRWTAWQQRSAAERSFALRFTIFSWLLAFIFILAILFLPNKGRVLMLVPVFIVGMSLAKWWQNTRERLRRDAEAATSFERARRIN
jgi:Flp pilus assembly protein TadB